MQQVFPPKMVLLASLAARVLRLPIEQPMPSLENIDPSSIESTNMRSKSGVRRVSREKNADDMYPERPPRETCMGQLPSSCLPVARIFADHPRAAQDTSAAFASTKSRVRPRPQAHQLFKASP